MTQVNLWHDGQTGEKWEIQHRYVDDPRSIWTTTAIDAFGPRAARYAHDYQYGRNEFGSLEAGLDFLRKWSKIAVGHKQTEFRLVHVTWLVKVERASDFNTSTPPICGHYMRDRYGHGAIYCQKPPKHRGKHDDLGAYQ